MRIIKSDAYGSFTAWGIGFYYEYDNDSKRLTIIHARRYKPLIDIDMQISTAEFASEFVETFEKAMQIQALLLSNHSTIDVTEIFAEKRLKSSVSNVLHTAGLALYLREEKFQSFGKLFCRDHHFETLRIQKTQYRTNDVPFYKLKILTQKHNEVYSQGFCLHACLASLAGSIISDLIFLETQHNFQTKAHELLAASSKLSTLSLVLDQNFTPIRKIVKKQNSENPRYA